MSDHSQEQTKYNKIVMLVHPLYYLIFDYYKKANKLSNGKHPKDFYLKLRTLLGNYGKELIKFSKDPKTLVIIVEPNFWFRGEFDLEKYKLYYKLMKRFLAFSKNILKDRVYVTNYDPSYKSKDLISFDLKDQLDKELRIESFGEYGDICVVHWRGYLEGQLLRSGHVIKSSRKNRELSFYGESNLTFDSLDARLMSARQSRKLRRKIIPVIKCSHVI